MERTQGQVLGIILYEDGFSCCAAGTGRRRDVRHAGAGQPATQAARVAGAAGGSLAPAAKPAGHARHAIYHDATCRIYVRQCEHPS